MSRERECEVMQGMNEIKAHIWGNALRPRPMPCHFGA